MGQRIKSIRKWASAALGAALLTTSIITGVGAANAAPAGITGTLAVSAGSTGGSGTITYTAPTKSVLSFNDPKCNYSTPLWDATHTRLNMGVLHRYYPPYPSSLPSTVLSVDHLTGCQSADHTYSNPTATGTRTLYEGTWTIPYACMPAGTPITMSSPGVTITPQPLAVPDNGPLPASCYARASILLLPESGAPGSDLVVSGYGYNEGERVTVKFDRTVIVANLAPWTIDGKFAAIFHVPADETPGDHLVTVSSLHSGTKTATFTVTGSPSPSPSPSPGSEGGSDHCGCDGSSSTGGTQHGQAESGTSGSAAHGGSAIVPGATTGAPTAPAPAAGTGGSAIVPGTTPVAAAAPAPAAPALTAGRGLAVQTAVGPGSAGPDQSALAAWSALTGLLGLAFAAVAARQIRRQRRRS